MSRVDHLIRELAPSGVPFVELAAVAKTLPGLSGKSKGDFSDGNARYVSYKNAFANMAVNQAVDDFVKVGEREKQNRLHLGDVVITGSSESLNEVGMSSVVESEPSEPLYLNSFCFAIRFDEQARLLPSFSKYLFRARSLRSQITRTASGVTRINVSKPRFMKVRIPLPPLKVQEEIVQLLDKFAEAQTELEVELRAEIKARRTQYDFYREKLLAVNDERSRQFRLDEIFDLRAGKFVAASDIRPVPDAEHSVPCYGGGGLRGYVSTSNQQGDLVLIGRQGALCGNVKRATGEFYATEHSVVVTPKDGADIRWAFHLLKNMNLNQYASKSAQPGLAVGTLNQLVVGVPSHQEQLRIGSILDKLDEVVGELDVDLPAELSARRVQYEHYRDRLLTFEEATR